MVDSELELLAGIRPIGCNFAIPDFELEYRFQL